MVGLGFGLGAIGVGEAIGLGKVGWLGLARGEGLGAGVGTSGEGVGAGVGTAGEGVDAAEYSWVAVAAVGDGDGSGLGATGPAQPTASTITMATTDSRIRRPLPADVGSKSRMTRRSNWA